MIMINAKLRKMVISGEKEEYVFRNRLRGLQLPWKYFVSSVDHEYEYSDFPKITVPLSW